MFDISFSELMLIGVVALVVLGPERLPRVARTVGHMFGRAQRYMNDVKSDIQREIDLDEITSIKKQMEDASTSLKDSVNQFGNQIKDPLAEARNAVNDLERETEKVAQSITDSSVTQTTATPPAEPSTSDDRPDDKKA